MRIVYPGVKMKQHCGKHLRNEFSKSGKERIYEKAEKSRYCSKTDRNFSAPAGRARYRIVCLWTGIHEKKSEIGIYDGLKSSAVAVEGAYDAAGEGDFTMLQSGNIIKGTFIVNNNYNLVDKLKEDAGIQAALFYGDAAVVSSFTDENRKNDLRSESR